MSRYETVSPDGRWAAFVKDCNLFLRDLSTGAIVQLTRDGEKHWDYATPLPDLRDMVQQGTENVQQRADVVWSLDSSKLVTYRLDSRNARLDKTWWNEMYQGYPVGKDYVEQSNDTLAGRLQGHLLLVHGDVDNNVNPVETMRFVDALIKANKNFDMLFVPNMFHGEGGNVYLIRRRWDYFVKHLLDVEPPANFQIKAPPPNAFNFGRRRRAN